MKWKIKDRIDDDTFIKVCNESISMANAASVLGLHFNSFKKRAIELKCYKTNQSGKGMKKSYNGCDKINLSEILEGKHPTYQTFKLKNRLLNEGLFENKCSCCGLDKWLGKTLHCELDHIDGNKYNHKLENLRMLCPNCHSQTETFRSKNRKNFLIL